MPAWQGKSKGNTLGYRIFVSVLKTAGVMPAYFMLRFVALYYFLFSWQTSKSTYYSTQDLNNSVDICILKHNHNNVHYKRGELNAT